MDIFEIRRLNLKSIIERDFDGNASALARKIEKDSSYINRCLYAEGKKAKKNISDEILGAIYESKIRPRGWMDVDHSEEGEGDYTNSHAVREELPYETNIEPNYPRVVGSARCGDKGYYLDLEGGDGYLEFETPHGAIALRIVGHSMHPAIRDGWYVVLEPNQSPEIGEYVLVKFLCGKKMVKELFQIKKDSYVLLSVNGDERITAMFDELDGDIQAITAVVPPSKHKEF